MYGYLVKKTSPELAQDIMQEAFTRLFARVARMADIGNARAYLFQIARHLLYNETAAARRFTAAENLLENTAAPQADNDPQKVEERELMQTLAEAVAALGAKERELFELRWTQGLTQTEIATVLKKSERQVRRDLEKLVSILRAAFKERGWPGEAGLA